MPYNINGVAFTGDTLEVNNTPESAAWNNDGTQLFIRDRSENVQEYTLTAGYDITTASLNQTVSYSGLEPTGIAFNNDGSKIYVSASLADEVNSWTLSTPYDISTQTSANTLDVSDETSSPADIGFNDDGSLFYVLGEGSNSLYEYGLSTPYDISTASSNDSLDVSSETTGVTGFTFDNDGGQLFVSGGENDLVYDYNLSSNYDVSTGSFDQSKPIQEDTPEDILWNDTGGLLFVIGRGGTVYEYGELGVRQVTEHTAIWDIETEHTSVLDVEVE